MTSIDISGVMKNVEIYDVVWRLSAKEGEKIMSIKAEHESSDMPPVSWTGKKLNRNIKKMRKSIES